MTNKKNYNNKKSKIVDKNVDSVIERVPQLVTGNYIIEVKTNGNTIKKIAVANAEVYITKLAEGGLTVEL